MRKKQFIKGNISAILAFCVAVGTGFSLPVIAKNDDSSELAATNRYLSLKVGNDKNNLYRFKLFSKDGNLDTASDDNLNMMYDNFYSSYTTIFLNNRSYRFGEGDNSSIQLDDNTIKSTQTFDNTIEVTQTLGFADGMNSGYSDMLHVSYNIKNLKKVPVEAGIRILLDIQENESDKCDITANDTAYNVEFTITDDIPEVWTAKTDSIQSFGKLDTKPDKLIIGNWNKLFDDKTLTVLESNDEIEDTAVAYVWDQEPIESEKNYAVFYGVKNLNVSEPSEESSEQSVEESSEQSVEESSEQSVEESSEQSVEEYSEQSVEESSEQSVEESSEQSVEESSEQSVEESSEQSVEESSEQSVEESSEQSVEESSEPSEGETSQQSKLEVPVQEISDVSSDSSDASKFPESSDNEVEYDDFETKKGDSVQTGENAALKYLLFVVFFISGLYVLIFVIRKIKEAGRHE